MIRDGQSTYCQTIVQHCENIKRPIHVVNLDPAAEHFNYPVSVGMFGASLTKQGFA